MNNNIPLPGSLTFSEWSQHFINAYPGELIPSPSKYEKWHRWAENLLNNPRFGLLPNPSESIYKSHDSWKRWAEESINYLNN